ncbi:hypothetical protein Taro_014351 [Colocasia esculenta]|uniref:rRNA processing protein EBP2 n=1 Tax=Colocasia esculenta TaxID=4460 RepID=A0A843UPV6_COLES|nr:hypothetical protein [Colocasia esculenta]
MGGGRKVILLGIQWTGGLKTTRPNLRLKPSIPNFVSGALAGSPLLAPLDRPSIPPTAPASPRPAGASRCRPGLWRQMGGMQRKDFLLAKENPLEEADDDIPDENDSEFESDADSEPEEVLLDEPSKKAIYNREGIIEKLEDICWPDNVQWVHKLTIDHNEEQEVDVNDDIVRELAFYTQALEGTRQAFAKIQSLGVPFFRPPDYYAEMVKTDGHMLKVKGRLLEEKKKIEEAEERKKAREAKKIAKEVQARKLKERSKQKKEEIESVKKWRKQRQQNGFRGGKDEDMDFDFDGEKAFEKSKKRKQGVPLGDRSGGKHGFRGQEKGKMKRERRNSKFGYGGRKGLKKQNTSETTDDFRGFNKGDLFRNKRRKG